MFQFQTFTYIFKHLNAFSGLLENYTVNSRYLDLAYLEVKIWSLIKHENLTTGFVCVEVLRPSQPNGVMSSVVSLPNHMFTGQA